MQTFIRFISGDLSSNRGRIVRLCRPDPFYSLLCSSQLHFCSRLEGGSYCCSKFVIQSVINEVVKFGDRPLNRFREIRPKVVGDGIFDGFFHKNFTPEVASDAVSGRPVGYVSVCVLVKCGDSKSNRFAL